MLEILLGQIPEAIYFALFMIFTKQLKEKRILFVISMVCEYLLLKQFLHYNLWFKVLYTIFVYMILKILYKEKAQIIDIFTFMISSFIMLFISIIPYVIIWFTINNVLIYAVIDRICMLLFLIIFKNKLYKIQLLYKKLWNRNDKINKKIKTTTFRCLNLVAFNFMFYLSNIIIMFVVYGNGGV